MKIFHIPWYYVVNLKLINICSILYCLGFLPCTEALLFIILDERLHILVSLRTPCGRKGHMTERLLWSVFHSLVLNISHLCWACWCQFIIITHYLVEKLKMLSITLAVDEKFCLDTPQPRFFDFVYVGSAKQSRASNPGAETQSSPACSAQQLSLILFEFHILLLWP